jgi:Ca-activated chloride channel family protein
MSFGRRTVPAVVALILVVAPCLGQSGRRVVPKETPQDVKGEPGADVQLGTQEVLLTITVHDGNLRNVKGLTQDDFIVAEDRVRQKIVSCTVASQPVNVVLLLDASGSVFSELATIRAAADAFVRALGPEDRVAVVQFAQKVELLQDWTNDRDAIEHAIDWRYRGGEATAFWDAVYLAGDQLFTNVEGPKAVVILSDGVDTSSKVSEEHARAALDRAGCSVFVVNKAQALIDKIRPYAGAGGVISGTSGQARAAIDQLERAQDDMAQMADRYGGRMLTPTSTDDLNAMFKSVADELKQQYLVTYVPQNEAHDARWRAIEVYVARPGLTARTRKGYIAE